MPIHLTMTQFESQSGGCLGAFSEEPAANLYSRLESSFQTGSSENWGQFGKASTRPS